MAALEVFMTSLKGSAPYMTLMEQAKLTMAEYELIKLFKASVEKMQESSLLEDELKSLSKDILNFANNTEEDGPFEPKNGFTIEVARIFRDKILKEKDS